MNPFDVRVFAIRRRQARRPYEVRRRVAGRDKSKSFITRALADSYRAELIRAARKGLEFDPATGEPVHLATVTGPPAPVRTYSAQTAVTARPVTAYGYDSFNDRTQAEDPDGNVTATGYDAAGWVTSVTQPSYTPPGAPSALTATTRYSYDEAGNLAQVTDRAGNATTYTYDALGDLTAQTDPQLPGQSAPGQWTYTYDAADERQSATSPLSEKTQATWNYFGEQATATDALNNTTHYSYDYLGDKPRSPPPTEWPPRTARPSPTRSAARLQSIRAALRAADDHRAGGCTALELRRGTLMTRLGDDHGHQHIVSHQRHRQDPARYTRGPRGHDRHSSA